MDKLIKYKAIVREPIQEIAAISPTDEQLETQLIMDGERGHYLF